MRSEISRASEAPKAYTALLRVGHFLSEQKYNFIREKSWEETSAEEVVAATSFVASFIDKQINVKSSKDGFHVLLKYIRCPTALNKNMLGGPQPTQSSLLVLSWLADLLSYEKV